MIWIPIQLHFQILNVYRELMNEGIFDVVTNVLQSQDKKLVLTGYYFPFANLICIKFHLTFVFFYFPYD